MKLLVFALIVVAAINDITAAPNSEAVCSPYLGYCQLTGQCCRDLVCLSYSYKCIPGKVTNDKRPIGDGPYPPKH